MGFNKFTVRQVVYVKFDAKFYNESYEVLAEEYEVFSSSLENAIHEARQKGSEIITHYWGEKGFIDSGIEMVILDGKNKILFSEGRDEEVWVGLPNMLANSSDKLLEFVKENCPSIHEKHSDWMDWMGFPPDEWIDYLQGLEESKSDALVEKYATGVLSELGEMQKDASEKGTSDYHGISTGYMTVLKMKLKNPFFAYKDKWVKICNDYSTPLYVMSLGGHPLLFQEYNTYEDRGYGSDGIFKVGEGYDYNSYSKAVFPALQEGNAFDNDKLKGIFEDMGIKVSETYFESEESEESE